MPVAQILYDAEFLGVALQRYRRQHPARFVSILVRWVGGPVLGAAAVLLFWKGATGEALGALLLFLLVIFSGALDQWMVKRSMVKSPYNGDELTIRFDEEGFHATSGKQDVKLRWDVFTRVAHFPDGFLLFQGPKFFNWIPFSAMRDGERAELEALLRKHIKEHKTVG